MPRCGRCGTQFIAGTICGACFQPGYGYKPPPPLTCTRFAPVLLFVFAAFAWLIGCTVVIFLVAGLVFHSQDVLIQHIYLAPLGFAVLLAAAGGAWAQMKGYTWSLGAVLTLILGVVGLLIIVFLPDLSEA
jgi:hypothetical protein